MISVSLYRKYLVQSHSCVNFGTSILNDSYNRLKYVFEQIIYIAAIENIYFAIKLNENMEY